MSERPAKNTPSWKELEQLCATIHKQLSPDADITHDDRITGVSGTVRKCDITIRQTIGSYQSLVVIDCKKHKRKLNRRDVAAFAEQRNDVRAMLGVMISSSGFDSGAVAVAQKENIHLRIFRKGQSADWEKLLGPKAWAFLNRITMRYDRVGALVDKNEVILEPETNLYGFDGTFLGPIRDTCWETWNSPDAPKPIGSIDILIVPESEGPLFLQDAMTDRLVSVERIDVSATVSVKKYLINLAFGSGNILEEFETGETVYRQLVSDSFKWEDILAHQEGADVSPDDWEKALKEARQWDITKAKAYLRFVVED